MTQKRIPTKINFCQASNLALDWALANDPSVFLLGEDIADEEGGGVMTVTRGLSSRYGTERVRSTPISEQAIVGAAIGASLVGMRPVAEIMMMDFALVAMDQIVNHAAKLRYMSGGQTYVPITLRMTAGVGGGTGGQHADMYEAMFAHVPGIKIAIPSTPAEAYGLLMSCIFDNDPCIFVENFVSMFAHTSPTPEPGIRIPLGKANVEREGKDVSVIGYGHPLVDVRKVAEKLETEGITVEIVDLRTVVPLDMDTVLTSVAKTGRAVIIHEAVRNFGVGAEVSARINEQLMGCLKAPVERIGGRTTPVPFSRPLEKLYMWSVEEIEAAVRRTLAARSVTNTTCRSA
ncbi:MULTISPECIES: alpha-ketoacid dehydrogenase subunit beta [Paraburkholderia]|uniref:Alpha-ketoacid dehydrogenase subunit beta n=1 Tax=Paraburkholderia guartelaensis TaxID=2546446 RepID=A0ABU9SDC0_9BURK|nr:alpha-ketoacid dehydrogenase subunit beta [Paraburkholderia nodosa]